MNKKTVLTLITIVFILSFFVTPMGHWGKIWLMKTFTASPDIIEVSKREKLPDYNWKLKDPDWNFFSFNEAKGKVAFVKFWASWNIQSTSELDDIQELYDSYGDKINFYIITDEERQPVETFMKENKYTFKLTYLIIGEQAPFEVLEAPGGYIIDKKGHIVVEEKSNADWSNATIHTLLNNLISE